MRNEADLPSASTVARSKAAGLEDGAWAPDAPATRYPLQFRSAGPATKRKRWQNGVAPGREQLYWNGGADAARPYGQIIRISLSSYDKAENDGGWCRVEFLDGSSLIVASGPHAGTKTAEREACYDEFLHALHARLGEADRSRITFHDGIPIPGSALVVASIAVGAVGFIPAVVAAALGDPGVGSAAAFGVIAATVVGVGLLVAQGRTEGRRYDPDALPGHALFGRPRAARTAPPP